MNENYSPDNTQLPQDSITENSFSTTIDLGGEFVVSRASSVVVLDTGATANLVCRAWLANHNLFLERLGMEKVHLYPRQLAFSLVMDELAKSNKQQIFPLVLQGARAPLQRL